MFLGDIYTHAQHVVIPCPKSIQRLLPSTCHLNDRLRHSTPHIQAEQAHLNKGRGWTMGCQPPTPDRGTKEESRLNNQARRPCQSPTYSVPVRPHMTACIYRARFTSQKRKEREKRGRSPGRPTRASLLHSTSSSTPGPLVI